MSTISDEVKTTKTSLEGIVVKLGRDGHNVLLTVKPNGRKTNKQIELPASVKTDIDLIPYALALFNEKIAYGEEVVEYMHEYCDGFMEERHDRYRKLEILSGKLKGIKYKF